MEPTFLLHRLDEIGRSLERSGHALALIGLGSVGVELHRLDAYSDLDFFAIVESGYKQQYLRDLAWLTDLGPAAYFFQNTADGYKFLYADGVFCEFAVFEPAELETAVYSPGRLIWKHPAILQDWSQPIRLPQPSHPVSHDPAWLLGEALTNLYVGLGRDRRGEKLTASRFIQVYALDRLLDWIDQSSAAANAPRDAFDIHRRFEQRFPDFAQSLPAMLQGYERNRQSALAILAFLEEHCQVPPAMAAAIRMLAAE